MLLLLYCREDSLIQNDTYMYKTFFFVLISLEVIQPVFLDVWLDLSELC